MLLLSVISLFKTPAGSPKNDKKLKELTEQVEKLEKENQDLRVGLASAEKVQGAAIVEQPTETSSATVPVTLRIDVANYNGEKLKVGTNYTVSVKNGRANYAGAGKWTLTNADIVRGKDTDVQITIKPNGPGNVVLSYKPNVANCTCESRSFVTEAAAAPTPNIVIDPNVSEVELDKEYTFSVTGYNGSGTWGVDGFSEPVNRNAKTIRVKAVDTGKGGTEATISFTPTGGKKVKEQYKIKKSS